MQDEEKVQLRGVCFKVSQICSIHFFKQMETTMQQLQNRFQNVSDQIISKNIFLDT